MRKMMPFQPLIERLHFALIAEPDPRPAIAIKKEPHILEALLHQRIRPGGQSNCFSRGHAAGYTASHPPLQRPFQRLSRRPLTS